MIEVTDGGQARGGVHAALARVGRVLSPVVRSPLRHFLLLVADAVAAVVCLWVAYGLRFEGHIPPDHASGLLALAALLACARVSACLVLRAHRWSFRYSGLADGARLWAVGFLGTAVFLTAITLLDLRRPPRSVIVLELLLSLTVMGLVRFSPRYMTSTWLDFSRSRNGHLHTVIVGAGAAGEMLLRDLQRSDEHSYVVVGFVDDDPAKRGEVIGGKTVLGSVADLPEIVRKHHVDKLLLAIPRLDAARIRAILSLCAELKVRFKILPVSFVYLNEQVTASMLKDLQPEDLLPREPVDFSDTGESGTAAGRCVLVTGAAGSIGGEICRQVLRAGVSRLIMVDMNENGLYLTKRRFEREFEDSSVVVEVGDIRDAARMTGLMTTYRPHDVFHAAAHKHVPLMETAPGEAVKNNILGTRNVALAAHEAGCERFVYISTDKAVRPTSVMGASKRVGEMVVRALGRRSGTQFKVVRFGNVLGSAGSVVPIFREQIECGGPVTVTHPDVRRYFMTISEAVGLVLKVAYGTCSDLCVLDMGEQIRIVDLARHMITMAGHVPEVDIKIEFSGLREGEKLFEELLTEEEEQTHLAMKKVFSATSPLPPANLESGIAELARAAELDDPRLVLDGLCALVPSFTPMSNGHRRQWETPVINDMHRELSLPV